MIRQLESKIMDEAAVDADKTSTEVDVRHLSTGAVQVEWTSTTAAATFQVQGKVHEDAAWQDISGKTQDIANDSDEAVIALNDVIDRYAYVRVFLDWTSGEVTTAKVYIHAKSKG